jgi:hypothetical protein
LGFRSSEATTCRPLPSTRTWPRHTRN